MPNQKELSIRQLMAIQRIIESSSIEEASKLAGVSRPTLYRWCRDEAFQKALKCQREKTINDSLERLKGAINKATDELIELLKTEKADLKRLVCKDILEFAIRALEMERIEKRIDEIEQVISQRRFK